MVEPVRLFLGGDVMTGRGIDQILPHPSSPGLHEAWVTDARGYVALAERHAGLIRPPVGFAYIWGDGLRELSCRDPDLRLVNLETSITGSDDYWRHKGIHYRMAPANVGCLTAAAINGCFLANNHVLDWGYPGLLDTLSCLDRAGICYAGAGLDWHAAAAPASFDLGAKGRVLGFALGFADSGIPASWRASAARAGVACFAEPGAEALALVTAGARAARQENTIVMVSLHWGGNWGYGISAAQREFAHALIDVAGVDVVHGHSSHHARGIEVYGGKVILYGCGDLINDYEGISGYEQYRGDLALMYFLDLEAASGRLLALELVPMQRRKFRLKAVSGSDRQWLVDMLNREGAVLGTGVTATEGTGIHLHWR